ncbi:hypothetical protein R5O11_06725 [Tenacibaculum maritimum]|uniref:hypothetical protein n=1 Tax=Tenacibaculum maritimum TaxID=107401 RepID=UPI00388EE8C9
MTIKKTFARVVWWRYWKQSQRFFECRTPKLYGVYIILKSKNMSTKELKAVELPKVEFKSWKECLNTVYDLISVCQSSISARKELFVNELNDHENDILIGSNAYNVTNVLEVAKNLLPVFEDIEIIETK